jgi:flagellar biosynthesis component FlhA
MTVIALILKRVLGWVTGLPLSAWIAIAFALTLGFGALQTHRLHAEKKAFATFKTEVKVKGEQAKKDAEKQIAADKRQKEKADEQNKRNSDSLNRELVRMRANNATRSLVPAATATASRPDLACFDRTDVDGALRAFTAGTLELVGEGAKATVDLDTARAWAQR